MVPPKVSVVISNYNYAEYVEVSINSVLSQTYEDVELIIVDDGSTDNSREILKRFEARATIVYKENGGETSGRNEGFRHTSGQIVAFLDADDYWKPEAVDAVVKAWNNRFSKVQFPLLVVDEQGRTTGGRMPRCRLDEGHVEHLLLRSGRYITCPTSGNFYSREFLESIFPVPTSEWPQSMDSYAATYAAFYGEIGAIRQPLGYYRVHGHNMTRISGDETINVDQLERLMGRGLRLRSLIKTIAQERQLTVSQGIVTSHWLYLKLVIARLALTPGASRRDIFVVVKKMLASVIEAPELSLGQRGQLILWTVGMALLPKTVVVRLVNSSFDLAPKSRLARAVRRT